MLDGILGRSDGALSPFNRTSMESKLPLDTLQSFRFFSLLIEPVWNRNTDLGCRLSDPTRTFNRTSMESKTNK